MGFQFSQKWRTALKAVVILTSTGTVTVFLSTTETFAQQEGHLKIPCGKGFLRPCTKADRAPSSHAASSASGKQSILKEEPVVPKLTKNILTYLQDYAAFLYNKGKDAKGNPIRYDSGKAVNLQSGEVQDFGSPTCSRCRTAFNGYTKEIADCGTPTTVRITSNGKQFIIFGGDALAWYRGVFTQVLNHHMNAILSEIRSNHSFSYAPGCKAMALKAQSLIQETAGPLEQLRAMLGKSGNKEKDMSEADFDKLLTELPPEENPDSVLMVGRTPANVRPDQGRLRQMAQHLRSLILNTEDLILQVALCTVFDRHGVDFRKNFGQWQEFFNASSMQWIEAKVENHVYSQCGHLFKYTTMGAAVDCANRTGNAIVPKVIDEFFDRKTAAYCADHITSDQQILSRSEENSGFNGVSKISSLSLNFLGSN